MPRVLVVDDEEAIRAVLREALEGEGYAVEEAADGKEGARRFAVAPADLVIIDIFMPEKEGLETMMEIREKHPSVPFIAISGGGLTASFDYLRYAEAFGAARTFAKPFRLEEVLAAVRELVGPADAAG